MIPKECKRLAEVDFPIAVVSKHAAREKSIRHGHPSTLHLWWARRPLASCRAMLLGLLLPDPCDAHCPEAFKVTARQALQGLLGVREGDAGLRRALITFIGDAANWDVAHHPRWMGVARELVRAAHGDEPPLVVAPFAGGGSIPLEALRLGCETFASDLNPVACLILKIMLEEIPRYGPELAEELRRIGAEIKAAAEKELAAFYPPDPDGAHPIAYLWARTVRCESPNCDAEIPLLRSFWLCKKSGRKWALRHRIVHPSRDRQGAEAIPLAYFITCSCYGTWLHGNDAGSVARDHNMPGTPFLSPKSQRVTAEQERMDQPPYDLDGHRRDVVLKAIQEVCTHRRWSLLAAHVRTNHLHVVVHALEAPERVMNDLKAYASRRLNDQGIDTPQRKRWTRHGSTRYLWQPEHVEAAIQYVVHEQGEPMAVFENEDRFLTVAAQTVAARIESPRVEFEIFEPKADREVPAGTVTRAKATCPCCNAVLSPERVRAQLREQHGGADVVFDEQGQRAGGARLFAVVTLKPGEQGRHYRLPTARDYEAVRKAMEALRKVAVTKLPNGLSPVPDEPLPPQGTLGFRVQLYGMTQWGDLFTARQKLALVTLRTAIANVTADDVVAREIASLALSRFADISNALCRWENTKTQVRNLFTRQALPIVWDFAEPSLFGEQAGDYTVTLGTWPASFRPFPITIARLKRNSLMRVPPRFQMQVSASGSRIHPITTPCPMPTSRTSSSGSSVPCLGTLCSAIPSIRTIC